MDLIDRCARELRQAIMEACAEHGGLCSGMPEGALSVNATFNPREVVMAVIAEMRSPGADVLGPAVDRGMGALDALSLWQAQIDTALGEQS